MTAPDLTAAPRLQRPRESAFRGVCSALARATGTDAVLWRVLFAVLVVFDGLGLLLYLVGMLVIPYEGEPQSLYQRLVHGPDRHLSGEQTLLVIVLAVVGIGWVGHPRSAVVLAVTGALGFLVWRSRTGLSTPTAGPHVAAAPYVPPAMPSSMSPYVPPAVAWQPPPRKPRSPLGGVTVAIAAFVAGVLALVGISGVDMPVAVPIAGALAVVGVGLVAGSFFGRSWGLVLLAGLLILALGVATGVQPLLDDGVGKRDWTPTGPAGYRLGAGKGVLDLSTVTSGDVTAHVGYGQLLVEVPAGRAVAIDARTDYGDIELYGKAYGGRHQRRTLGDSEAAVRLHLTVRAGEIKVVQQ